MLRQLKRHPLSIRAHFEHSLVLTFAVPEEQLRFAVPSGLELDKYEDVALLAIALVQTRSMRPAVLPACLGQSFFLVGCRIFVKYRDRTGRTLRGLRILGSYANRPWMVVAGNLLTHYQYRPAHIRVEKNEHRLRIEMRTDRNEPDLDVEAELADCATLPEGSPFEHLKAARRYAGPLPYTFDHEPQTNSIIVIEGQRTNWNPRPVRVQIRRNTLLRRFVEGADTPVLANAFYVSGVEYCWLRGRCEPLGGDIHDRGIGTDDRAPVSPRNAPDCGIQLA